MLLVRVTLVAARRRVQRAVTVSPPAVPHRWHAASIRRGAGEPGVVADVPAGPGHRQDSDGVVNPRASLRPPACGQHEPGARRAPQQPRHAPDRRPRCRCEDPGPPSHDGASESRISRHADWRGAQLARCSPCWSGPAPEASPDAAAARHLAPTRSHRHSASVAKPGPGRHVRCPPPAGSGSSASVSRRPRRRPPPCSRRVRDGRDSGSRPAGAAQRPQPTRGRRRR